ncbi:hypothetical protein BC835DRAFT_482135 [Cytidiella melzeri]|nr:hypothetical protein BC835DRAFT_482135 [Cytidiella melzeri]
MSYSKQPFSQGCLGRHKLSRNCASGCRLWVCQSHLYAGSSTGSGLGCGIRQVDGYGCQPPNNSLPNRLLYLHELIQNMVPVVVKAATLAVAYPRLDRVATQATEWSHSSQHASVLNIRSCEHLRIVNVRLQGENISMTLAIHCLLRPRFLR